MGILSRMSSSAKRREMQKLLEAGYVNLKLGILALLMDRYRPYGDQAHFLAVAVLHEALILEPANSDGETYRRKNAGLIRTEAMRLSSDQELVQAFAYMYAARTLYITFATGSPVSEQGVALANRATELSLHIPNTYELCGSSDCNACLHAIFEYSE